MPSCSAAIQTSAASSTIFLPMACTPASSAATVPDPSGRVTAFSVSSAYRSSKVFTRQGYGERGAPRVTAVATAAMAASCPLSSLDPGSPARSSACASSSQVSTPKPMGIPVRDAHVGQPVGRRRSRRSRSAVCHRGSRHPARPARRMPGRAARTRRSARRCPAPARAARRRRPASARARTAPATSPSITAVCQDAATMATRRPLPSAVHAGRSVPAHALASLESLGRRRRGRGPSGRAWCAGRRGWRRSGRSAAARPRRPRCRSGAAPRPWPGCWSAVGPTSSPSVGEDRRTRGILAAVDRAGRARAGRRRCRARCPAGRRPAA